MIKIEFDLDVSLCCLCIYTSDVCPPPYNDADPRVVSKGKHCRGSCINGNLGYNSLSEAWHRCGKVTSCAFILQYSDGLYYLRRSSDDDALGFKGYIYSGECGICYLKNVLSTNIVFHLRNGQCRA